MFSIGDTAIEEKLLSTITQASDLLIPHSAIIKQLTDVTPVISGAFIFKSPDNDGHFRLDIEFKQMKDWMERLSTRWSKLDGKTASQVLGISHIRLET